jgi:hypothetical protein
MKASKYKNKKHYKKQKTRKHNKKYKRITKHRSKKRRYLRRKKTHRKKTHRKKIKGGKTFPIFYNQNETLGNIYPLSKTGIPAGGNELAQRAEPVYQAGQLKGGASNIPLTGEITNVLRSGIHSMSELGRGAIGDNPGTNPSPTADHFNHTGGTGAKGNVNNMTYLDNALIAANSATRSY